MDYQAYSFYRWKGLDLRTSRFWWFFQEIRNFHAYNKKTSNIKERKSKSYQRNEGTIMWSKRNYRRSQVWIFVVIILIVSSGYALGSDDWCGWYKATPGLLRLFQPMAVASEYRQTYLKLRLYLCWEAIKCAGWYWIALVWLSAIRLVRRVESLTQE